MTPKQTFTAMQVLSTNYRTEIAQVQVSLFYEFLKDITIEQFEAAIYAHMVDPDEGKYFPTAAHIISQLTGTEKLVKAKAADNFNENPGIDGAVSFDVQRESHYDRDARKRAYILHQVGQWSQGDLKQRIQYAENNNVGLLPCKSEALGITH